MTQPDQPPGAEPAGVPARGTSAPDFALPDQHGRRVSLHELQGAPVLLFFFPYAFSGVCSQELTALQAAGPELTAHGAQVVAVSTDTVYALRTFAEELRLDFGLLSDFWPHGEVARRYGVFDAERGCAVRGSFVLDAAGRVHWSIIGELGRPRDLAGQLAALRDAAGHRAGAGSGG